MNLLGVSGPTLCPRCAERPGKGGLLRGRGRLWPKPRGAPFGTLGTGSALCVCTPLPGQMHRATVSVQTSTGRGRRWAPAPAVGTFHPEAPTPGPLFTASISSLAPLAQHFGVPQACLYTGVPILKPRPASTSAPPSSPTLGVQRFAFPRSPQPGGDGESVGHGGPGVAPGKADSEGAHSPVPSSLWYVLWEAEVTLTPLHWPALLVSEFLSLSSAPSGL